MGKWWSLNICCWFKCISVWGNRTFLFVLFSYLKPHTKIKFSCKAKTSNLLEEHQKEYLINLEYVNISQTGHTRYETLNKKLINYTPLKVRTFVYQIYHQKSERASLRLGEYL